jgi:predicted nucleotidyltransferase
MMTKNELINERWKAFFQERYDPEGVDVSSFKFQKELYPKIWLKQSQLDPEIRARLLKIANDFFKSLQLPNVNILDVIFTGSLANYNWSNYSDIDLHIIVDFTQVDENFKLVKDFFNGKKADWNSLHNIDIFGFEVEVYVQDVKEPHVSTGIYSLMKNQWIERPDPRQPDIDWQQVKVKAASLTDQIDRAQEQYYIDDFDGAYAITSQLREKVKKLRKAGLDSEAAQNSVENLAFKVLRRTGYLKKLLTLRINSYDKKMSVDDKQDKRRGTPIYEQTEPYQRKVRAKHEKNKLSTKGPKVKEPPFDEDPPSGRGKSAPPLGESEDLLTEASPKELKKIYPDMAEFIDQAHRDHEVPNKYLHYVIKKTAEYAQRHGEGRHDPGDDADIRFELRFIADLVNRYDEVFSVGKLQAALKEGSYDHIQDLVDASAVFGAQTAFASKINVLDITSFMKQHTRTLQYVVDIAEEIQTASEKKRIAKDETVVIHEDETFLIVSPQSHGSSCLYGKSTQWCTSARNSEYWEDYHSQGIFLVYVIDKTKKAQPLDSTLDISKIAFSFKKTDPEYSEAFDAQDRTLWVEELGRLDGYSTWWPIVQAYKEKVHKENMRRPTDIKVGDLVKVARVGTADRTTSLMGLWAVVKNIEYESLANAGEDYITVKWAATPGRWRRWGLENVKKNDDSRTRNSSFFRDQLDLVSTADEFEKRFNPPGGVDEPIEVEPEDAVDWDAHLYAAGGADIQESVLNYRGAKWDWITK